MGFRLTNTCVTDDKFDPVPIANKLREVADELQEQWGRELPAALLPFRNPTLKVGRQGSVQKASFGHCYMPRIKRVVVYLLDGVCHLFIASLYSAYTFRE